MGLHRNEIRKAVSDKLTELGFSNGVVAWGDRPAELKVLVNTDIKIIKLKSGMSRRGLEFELDKLETWAIQRRSAQQRALVKFERDPEQIDLEDEINAKARLARTPVDHLSD